MGYVLIALVPAVLCAAVLVAGPWLRASGNSPADSERWRGQAHAPDSDQCLGSGGPSDR